MLEVEIFRLGRSQPITRLNHDGSVSEILLDELGDCFCSSGFNDQGHDPNRNAGAAVQHITELFQTMMPEE